MASETVDRVTAPSSPPLETTATRNDGGRPLEEIERDLGGLLGPPPSEAEREARRRSYRADHEGGLCGRCGRALDPGELVYRLLTVPTCQHCVDADRQRLSRYPWALQRFDECLRPPKPCEGCGRPVVNQWGSPQRIRTVCSDRCAWTVRNAPLKAARLAARQHKTCPVCGGVFDGTRADQVTCSAACRQKAYRQRRAAAMSTKVDIPEEAAG